MIIAEKKIHLKNDKNLILKSLITEMMKRV